MSWKHGLKTSVRTGDELNDSECPYGASDCPKIKDLRRMLQDNRKELEETKLMVVQLNTTLKTVGKILGGMMTIVVAIVGGSYL